MISDRGSSRTATLASLLNPNTSKLVSTTERLSSGLRILRASDDAAGLSLSKKTATGGALYHTAMGNINSGQPLVNVAASARDAKELVMTKFLDLAQQATSTLLSTSQRESLKSEAQLLRTEYEGINATASYNNKLILTDRAVKTTVQTGPRVTDRVQFTFGEDVGSASFDASVYGTSFDGTFQTRTTQASGAAWLPNAALAKAGP